MPPSNKTYNWRSTKLPESAIGLRFVKNNPKVFGTQAMDEIRTIIFQNHFPEVKHAKRFILSESLHEIQVCLTSDKKTIYIGAPGGMNAVYVCKGMFKGLHRVENIIFEYNSFHTDEAVSFAEMFKGCRSLKSVNVKEFKTGKSTTFCRMFDGCENLTELNMNGLDTSSAYEFTRMFNDCKRLKTLSLYNFYIHKGVRYSKYFNEKCDSVWFRVPPLITGMFAGCESLAELDLKSFRTADVNNFSYMFENCRNLERLVIAKGGFIIQKDAVTDKMFAGCGKLGVENSNLMKGRPRESYM